MPGEKFFSFVFYSMNLRLHVDVKLHNHVYPISTCFPLTIGYKGKYVLCMV